MDLRERLRKDLHFTENDLETTFRYFVPEKLPAKSYFLKEGKISDKVAFVSSGLLRSFFYNDNADEITTHFFQSGSVVISLYSFNNRVASKEYIVAIENCELLAITFEDMQDLCNEVPAWNQIIKHTDDYRYQQQMNRSIRFQTLSATERYQQLLEKKPELIQKVALRHIATYLGIDIATLSRIRKKL